MAFVLNQGATPCETLGESGRYHRGICIEPCDPADSSKQGKVRVGIPPRRYNLRCGKMALPQRAQITPICGERKRSTEWDLTSERVSEKIQVGEEGSASTLVSASGRRDVIQ